MAAYPIIYEGPERDEHVRGVVLPLFINNFHYHLTHLTIFEDGVADCWELVKIEEVGRKVAEGWLTTEPPEGAEISVSCLGGMRALDARWFLPRGRIAETAMELFNGLNPTGANRADLDARRKKIAAEDGIPEDKVWVTRFVSNGGAYRIGPDGDEIRGGSVPLLHKQGGEYVLVDCFIFRDRMARIGEQGALLPAADLEQMLERGTLATSAPDGAWVTIEGLGRFRATDARWYIDPHERWREILGLIETLNGGPDCIETCYQAFLAFQAEPIEANRERLRAAYEAVPEHQRIYTQRSMDDKDHDIRRILRTG